MTSITATGGTPQNATVNTKFGQVLIATVVDSFGNLVSGATVTFTAPNTPATASFSGSTTSVTVTGTNGQASSAAFT